MRVHSMALLRPRLLPNHVNNLFPLSRTLFPTRSFASKRAASSADDQDEDLAAARTWLASLNPRTIPRHLCEVSFSRSGGPGGQHVNKYVSSLNCDSTAFKSELLTDYRQGQLKSNAQSLP